MDRLSYPDLSLRDLSAIQTIAHREHVAVEVLRAAWRRRSLCAALALGLGALSIAHLATREPTYPAEAIIELHVGRADPAGGESAAGVQVEASSIVLSEARIIRSRMITSRVVERLGLEEDPLFMRDGRATRIMNRIERALGVPDQVTNRRAEAERRLSRSLAVETDNRSHLISIRFTGGAPDFAAKVANTVAEEYLARRLEASMDTAGHTAAWLTDQVAAAEAQMRAADTAVRAWRERTGFVQLGVAGETLRQQEVRAVALQLEAVIAEWRAEEQRLLVIEAARRAGGSAAAAAELSSMPAVLAASQLSATARRDFSEIHSRLGPRHPAHEQALAAQVAAEERLDETVDNALAVLRTGLDARRSTEESLRARLSRLEQDLVGEAGDQAELANLTGLAAAARERVVTLSRGRDQARGLRELRIVPASLIVPAQPPREASRPNIFLVGFAAFFAGLLGGIGLSALLERRDRGLRTTDEVMEGTGLRCVGIVPEQEAGSARTTGARGPDRTPSQTMFDESVRIAASSIGLFASARREGGQIVLVTSSLSDEGLCTLCSGLARLLRVAGRRVLLINGPPGRFNPSDSQPSAGKGDVVLESPTHPPDGAAIVLQHSADSAITLDVFDAPDTAAALEQARKHFDVIIIEAPPVLLVADSLVLGRMADNVLHVVRWGNTTRRNVRAALRRLHGAGITVDGVVLTRVDVEQHARLGLADAAAHHLSPHGYYTHGTSTRRASQRVLER